MANFFELKDRRVLPNWRSFISTVMNGELNNLKSDSKVEKRKNLSIDDYLLAWKQETSIPIASDLISAAFTNGFKRIPEIEEAAKFILSNKEKSTESQRALASFFISDFQPKTREMNANGNRGQLISLDKQWELISNFKKKIHKYNFNPIFYVDLSRLYSILGNEEKAIRNMRIALQLSQENRFVLRAAARLFSHFGRVDFIHDIIRKSDIVRNDPWITSTEIALTTIIGRRSKFVKIGRKMIDSSNFSPFDLTELAASIGTLEFINGNRKKSKKLFKTALKLPNDNSLAQTEWIISKDRLFEFNPADYEVDNKHEALALDNYFSHKWDEALNQCVTWYCDIPFSKRPIILGSNIATIFLNNSPIGRKILQAGLISHPNDAQIINNLSYSFALEDKIKEAEDQMNRIKKTSLINETTRICLTATQGLISFRKGEITKGRELYLKAIAESKKIGNEYYNWSAILNYAREEIKAGLSKFEFVKELLGKIPDNTKYPEVNKLKENVIELIPYNRKR